jgi:hypothetical protein
LEARSSVDRDPVRATFGGHLSVGVDGADVIPTKPQLCGDGNMGRKGISNRADDVADTSRMEEERGTAVVPVNRRGWAAEVEVDGFGSGFNGRQGGDGETVGVATQ